MEDRYVFSKTFLDKDNKDDIDKLIHKKIYGKKESNTITLLIMGHGRERYKENFKKVIEYNPNYYSEPFMFKVSQQENDNNVRILSKAGKPKICAWDYSLCTETMSSQDIMLELSRIFFSHENKEIDTFTLMNSLSIYFKKIYPKIITKISKNYRDLPDEKNPYSPDAEGYEKRYYDFQEVLDSLYEDKYSGLKALNHQKIFTIRPDTDEEYKSHCEKYLFEIVDLRTSSSDELTDFIVNRLKIRENLVKNYFEMSKEQLQSYIDDYKTTIYTIHSLKISDYDKYFLIKFIFNLYFGHEIMMSEIIEVFVILGIETINIIDNTCRIQEKSRIESSSVKTAEIEEQERIKKTESQKEKNLAGHTRKKTSKRRKKYTRKKNT
jgi:hypothetical protein